RKKTAGRKLFEFFCARRLEDKFTKDQILLLYLNFAYFGHGCWGLESASRFYFGKPARELELAECAMLAGIIASPNNYSPHDNLELAKARHRTVLRRMAAAGFIPESAIERYSTEFWARMESRLNQPEVSFWRMRVNEAPYVVEAVRRQLEKDYSKERILKGGLRVRTTVDLALQKAAQEAMAAGLRETATAAKAEPGAKTPPLEGALVALDPKDGAVLAAVGGRGFDFRNQLLRSFDIRRPIGSSVKPFIYAEAIESGKFKPDDTMVDEPISFKNPGGKAWKPQNYGGKYYGKVTLAQALAKSLNSVAIRILDAVDIDAVISLLSKATGREPKDFPRNLSLALGTVDLSPAELAAAYSLFVNGARPVQPHLLAAVEDRDGHPLKEWAAPPPAEVALSSRTCAAAIELMRGVLAEGGSAYGAAQRAGFSLPAAGKTGTTNDYRDAWFAGVTPDLAAAVWLGHDDMRVALGQGATGGALAAPIWMRFIKEAYRNRPTREFDTIAPVESAHAAP
ncbi:MAG TPA: transglycosylase domain-containing protein, partial [Elusimicrobiota bacterium]|nr:transglycosylase domain-containing protein [Elusimicrobiota bacterium]